MRGLWQDPSGPFGNPKEGNRVKRMKGLNSDFCRIALVFLLCSGFTCTAVGIPVLDIQELRILEVEPEAEPAEIIRAEVAVIGGGLGGFAAVLALGEAGRSVVWSEETDWLGGQFTSQGMSAPDENIHIEQGGGTLSYQQFRVAILDWYLRHHKLSERARRRRRISPGNAWVSRLSFEPKVALTLIEEWIAPLRKEKRLRVLTRHKAFRAACEGDRVLSLDLLDLESSEILRLEADVFLDASEMGDLWPLCRAEHVIGAESLAETGEPHARPDGADPGCVQSFTYAFALEHLKGADHCIPRPTDYERFKRDQPFELRYDWIDDAGQPRSTELDLFERIPRRGGSIWTYRRLIDRLVFKEGEFESDLSLINWPTIDYRGNLLSASPEEALAMLRDAKALSLGFLYWLQTEAPHEGGIGYPGLRLSAETMGTADGLAKFPYIREARRAKTLGTLREQDISAAENPGRNLGRFFRDSIGVGHYFFDIHAGECDENLPPAETLLFQIPMGVLVPVRIENLIPAGKSAGTTHLTSSCTRLHPVEWAIGEAAGLLANRCLEDDMTPQKIYRDPARVRGLQEDLVNRRVPIRWVRSIPPQHPHFRAFQLKAFD